MHCGMDESDGSALGFVINGRESQTLHAMQPQKITDYPLLLKLFGKQMLRRASGDVVYEA